MTWQERVDAYWRDADDARPERMLAEMAALVRERPDGDADALFELASAHDFLGREADAIPLYRAALATGLGPDRRSQAVIQLASSLRNVGDAEAAVELLRTLDPDEHTGAAARAFLALALHDLGRSAEALRVALTALAPTLPRYARAVEHYATELST